MCGTIQLQREADPSEVEILFKLRMFTGVTGLADDYAFLFGSARLYYLRFLYLRKAECAGERMATAMIPGKGEISRGIKELV